MNLKETVKPITHLKNHAAEVVRDVSEEGSLMVVTQNGEAKVVVMGVEQYDSWKRSMVLLKLLALGEADISNDSLIRQDDVFDRVKSIIEKVASDE